MHQNPAVQMESEKSSVSKDLVQTLSYLLFTMCATASQYEP